MFSGLSCRGTNDVGLVTSGCMPELMAPSLAGSANTLDRCRCCERKGRRCNAVSDRGQVRGG